MNVDMGKRIELHMDTAENLFDKPSWDTSPYGWIQEVPTDSGIDMSESVRAWCDGASKERKMRHLWIILVANR